MEGQKKLGGLHNRLRLKYFTCLQGEDHYGEALNYVCISRDCPKRGLLCSICKLEHQHHTILPLKFLLSSLRSHNE